MTQLLGFDNEDYSSIIANIILLPLPINDHEIFKRVEKFYELAEFLLKIEEACQHFPNVLPQFR